MARTLPTFREALSYHLWCGFIKKRKKGFVVRICRNVSVKSTAIVVREKKLRKRNQYRFFEILFRSIYQAKKKRQKYFTIFSLILLEIYFYALR